MRRLHRFLTDGPMGHSHDHTLVLLSLVVSLFGSFTGLMLASRIRHATGLLRGLWLGSSAVAVGGGAIWSMHFVAMLAFSMPPLDISYDPGLTLLSLVIAVAFTAIGMANVARADGRLAPLLNSGVMMGLAVAAMHYTGMAAINMNATSEYDPLLVGVSIAIAISACTAALWLAFNHRTPRMRYVGSAVMAAAVCGMHYTAMTAVTYSHGGHGGHHMAGAQDDWGIPSTVLAVWIAVANALILLIGLGAAVVDGRRVEQEKRATRKLAEAAANEARLRMTLDSVPQMLWSVQPDGSEEYYNEQWSQFTGHPAQGPSAVRPLSLIHPDDTPLMSATWQECTTAAQPFEIQFRMLHSSGEYRWVQSRVRPQLDETGNVARWYGSCTDVQDDIAAREALRASERLNRGIIEASPDGVSLVSPDGNVLFVNQTTLREYGLADADSLVGQPWGSRFDLALREKTNDALARALNGEVVRMLLQRGGGDERWWDVCLAPVLDAADEPTLIVIISRDITAHKNAEETARWSANHDPLTGLANRFVLQNQLELLMEHSGDEGQFTLLLLDLDDFKKVNDTVGHDAGDALLCEFASRLKKAVGPQDLVARLGGDEFAIILKGVDTRADVVRAASAIFAQLKEPCEFDGRLFDCHASIGAGIFPWHGRTRSDLLKSTDVALYAAKAAGGSNLRLFAPRMRLQVEKRARMLALARNALDDRLIVPFYQPKVDLADGSVAGYEALLRWNDPRKGVRLPATIGAAFENSTLAAQISDCMVSQVIDDLLRWRERGVDVKHVAINASPAEFRRGGFAERLLERLHAASLPPSCIQVEVTETVFLGRGADFVETALKTLSQAGVIIALDDFGTGYASLSHLKQFPVDLIKIDKSFVQDLEADPDDYAIVEAVINLGRSLQIEIIAEGVERAIQQDTLTRMGCRYGQGFLFDEARPAAEINPMLFDLSGTARSAAA